MPGDGSPRIQKDMETDHFIEKRRPDTWVSGCFFVENGISLEKQLEWARKNSCEFV